MTIPTSGPVSFNTLKSEYNDTDPVRLNEFYRGSLVPDSPINNGGVPTSGEISLSDLRGSSNEFVVELSNSTNVDVQSLFSASIWSSSTTKTVVIPSGVVVGSTSVATPAITVPNSGGGSVFINNQGSIQGRGGVGGVPNSGTGGAGGPAIAANRPVSIQNTGEIYGGGGGGGAGGRGNNGGCGTFPSYSFTNCGSCAGSCNPGTNKSENPNGGICNVLGPGLFLFTCTITCTGQPRPASTGGNGGTGGIGEGYQQNATSGTNGGSSNQCGSGGTGGTGGSGGSFGTSGNTGGSGSPGSAGGAGGLAGAYIINDSNVTWIGPRGTVAGRVA